MLIILDLAPGHTLQISDTCAGQEVKLSNEICFQVLQDHEEVYTKKHNFRIVGGPNKANRQDFNEFR
jgi:hypothetical protein